MVTKHSIYAALSALLLQTQLASAAPVAQEAEPTASISATASVAADVVSDALGRFRIGGVVQNPVATQTPSTPDNPDSGSGGSSGTGGSSTSKSEGLVTVWWGQTKGSSLDDLKSLCSSDGTDIVLLSFLTHFFDKGSDYPKLNLGVATTPPGDKFKEAKAEGLYDACETGICDIIQTCQSNGKKVWLSFGGDSRQSDVVLKSDDDAKKAAQNIWNLFLGGTDEKTKDIRPFGDIVLDGVDNDNESGKGDHYDTFTKELRSLMGDDGKYKLGAAPQCPGHSDGGSGGDHSIPDDILRMYDYVWVQFYNNDICKHGSDGFEPAVRKWSEMLEGSSAQLWIGTPPDKEAAGIGSVDIKDIGKEIETVKGWNLPNFGGYAIWDGTYALRDKDDKGNTYDQVVKAALGSS